MIERTPAPKKPVGRIPSLDGLRAFSIGLVIVNHLAMRLPASGNPWIREFSSLFNFGHLGVMVFFVISGFLITSILLKDFQKDGNVNLARFYYRRVWRIFPPYYALLLVLVLMVSAGWIRIPAPNLFAALTYTSDYCVGCPEQDTWYTAHTWSLSVEEQFYLIWPFALYLLGKQKGILAPLFFLAACPLIRILMVLKFHGDAEFYTFETVADSLAAGCVLAFARPFLHGKDWYLRTLHTVGWWGPAIALGLTLLPSHPSIFPPLQSAAWAITAINLTIMLYLDWCVTDSGSRTWKLLNWGPLVSVGVGSYSLYLWQQLFLEPHASPLFSRFPVNLLCVGLCAAGSYFLIERTALRFREKWESALFSKPAVMASAHAGLPEQS